MLSRIQHCVVLLLIISIMLLVSACESTDNAQSADQGDLRIFFINVGKGDAALIGTPDEKWFMIDVGDEEEHAHVLRILKQNNVKELEAIFISHPHYDHVGALAKVLEHTSCKVIYTTPVEFPNRSPRMRQMAGDVPIQTLSAGDEMHIGDLHIQIIGPNGIFDEENDNSIVQMLTWNGQKALFTGDQEIEAEKALLAKGWPVQCDVLKVGHHGQETASSEAFMKAARPKYSIITNDFGNKKYDEAMERFSPYGTAVYVLGKTGTLKCEMGGGHVRFYGVSAPLDEPVVSLRITALDTANNTITIQNNGSESVALYGFSIQYGKLKDAYFFEDDAVIAAGDTIVLSDPFFGTIKGAAILLDIYGREVSTAQ